MTYVKDKPVAGDFVRIVRMYCYRGNSPDDLEREVVYEAYQCSTGRLKGVDTKLQRLLWNLRGVGYHVVSGDLVQLQRSLMKAAFPGRRSAFIQGIPTEILARLIKTYCYRGDEVTIWYETEDVATGVSIAWSPSRREVVAITRRRGYLIPAADLVDPLTKLIFS